jgi:hypothetical protein
MINIVKDEFVGCGKVVWGNNEFGTLNCGDPCGRWVIDNTSGTREWIEDSYFKCQECSQKTSKEKNGK